MPIKQESRLLAIKTALGPNVLGVRSVLIREQMSRLFAIEAELSSEDATIDFDKVIGRGATIRLDVGQKEKRYFDGIISRLTQLGNQGGFAQYRATIVPWLWFLTRTSDCYIFQEMSVPEIIEDVFKSAGFNDYKLKLSATYQKWEYCVQYRETDFNFVSRLMEQEGIYYYFEHQEGKHTLVLADSISAHKAFPGYAEITFHTGEKGAAAREVITEWTIEKEVQPVSYALQDFDFTKPKTSLLVNAKVNRTYGKAEYEMYDYPGEYDDTGDGDRLSDVRLHELQAQYEVVSGHGSSRGIAPGCTFKLKNHPRDDQDREYLVTSVIMKIDAGEFAAGEKTVAASQFFSCNFSAIAKTQQFRPPRLTPKPMVQGPQTATVVGPGGEEIYTDKYGRVKVHFPWDRHDKQDENSSCWIRVSQYWAGKEWGTIHTPRIGQEVIVEFLEGDPDQPIITGRVYNAEQMPPYALPGNKTQSGIKSRSSKDAGTANFNEIRFEDKKGSEMLTIHAEKDQEISVEHDETHTVGNDRHKTIDHDETTEVKHDRTEEVGNNEKITIGGDRTEEVKKDEGISIGGSRTESVTKDESISIGGSRTEDVSKDETVSVDGKRDVSIGKDESLSVGGKRTISVDKDEQLEVGGNRTKTVSKDEKVTISQNLQQTISKNHAIKVGASFILEATDDITIKTGSASITMQKDGTIQIKGKDITVDGSGKINAKASSDMILKGSKIAAN